MSTPELEVIENVAKVAALAGVKGQVNQRLKRFEATYKLDDGRVQRVFVRVISARAVRIYALCLKVKKGFLQGIKREQALDLLRRNEQMPFARYGIAPLDGEDLIVASVDHILDTLDPQELASHMRAVTQAADAYEKEHDRDVF